MAQEQTLKQILNDLLNDYDKLVIDLQRWGTGKDLEIRRLKAIIKEQESRIQAQNETMVSLLNLKD